MRNIQSVPATGVLLAALFFAGCASTTPAPRFSQTLLPLEKVGSSDVVKAVVTCPSEVGMLAMEQERLAQRIEERINAKKNAQSPGDARDIEIDLVVTRYDKGNKFARAMLAGLGQIHLEGTVAVFVLPEKRQIATFDLKKTFAWGGIYGSAVDMEDIERTFAEAVASAVTGTAEEETRKNRANQSPEPTPLS